MKLAVQARRPLRPPCEAQSASRGVESKENCARGDAHAWEALSENRDGMLLPQPLGRRLDAMRLTHVTRAMVTATRAAVKAAGRTSAATMVAF